MRTILVWAFLVFVTTAAIAATGSATATLSCSFDWTEGSGAVDEIESDASDACTYVIRAALDTVSDARETVQCAKDSAYPTDCV